MNLVKLYFYWQGYKSKFMYVEHPRNRVQNGVINEKVSYCRHKMPYKMFWNWNNGHNKARQMIYRPNQWKLFSIDHESFISFFKTIYATTRCYKKTN